MNVATRPFLSTVVDSLMAGIVVSDAFVGAPLVGNNSLGSRKGLGPDKPVKGMPSVVINDLENNVSATLDSTRHDGLVAFVSMSLTPYLPTDISLIHFNGAREGLAVGLGHGCSYPVAKIPRCLIGDIEQPLHLVGGDALLGFHHDGDSQEPLLEREFGIMEDGTSQYGETVITCTTMVLSAGCLPYLYAPTASAGKTIGPAK